MRRAGIAHDVEPPTPDNDPWQGVDWPRRSDVGAMPLTLGSGPSTLYA